MSEPIYKGRFTGIFTTRNKRNTGYFVVGDMRWTYLRIEDCTLSDEQSVELLKTGDYWYAHTLRNDRKGRFHWPWQARAEIFMPQGEHKYYEDDLRNVLLRNIRLNPGTLSIHSKDWEEASGDIYFQLKPLPKPTAMPSVVKDNLVKGTNINNDPIIVSGQRQGVSTTNTVIITDDRNQTAPVSGVSGVKVGGDTGSLANGFGWLFNLFFLLMIGYFLWRHFPTLAIIYLVVLFLRGIGMLFKTFPVLKQLATLAIFGFIAYFFYQMYLLGGTVSDPLKTRNGSIKVSPPKRTDDRSKGESPDYSTEKEIQWFDFSERGYLARYQTSQASYESSVVRQTELHDQTIQQVSSSLEFYTQFYMDLHRLDEGKIKSIVKIFSDSAAKLRLDPLETAEMVVTFVQEIPYVLVHEESCRVAMESGNDFIIKYHKEKKPCMPNIVAGVQSPYEFMHNLKGDCDTRTLLAFSILSGLNIGSSVWVSEVYGHSILGVAVPAGHGMSKEVRGVKHYGVELTAKGFRVGMVAPDQARPGNWDITAYYNPN